MKAVDIVPEDEVAFQIIARLIKECNADITIRNRLPLRPSGRLLESIERYNKLASRIPVIMLLDSDSVSFCPVDTISRNLETAQSRQFYMRFAVDECESWLIADDKNFPQYFGLDPSLMPGSSPLRGWSAAIEPAYTNKASMFLTKEVAEHPQKSVFKQQLRAPTRGYKKHALYNAHLEDFITKYWDPHYARKHSTSLEKAINAIASI